jgi:hypothetical protein
MLQRFVPAVDKAVRVPDGLPPPVRGRVALKPVASPPITGERGV